MKVSPEVEQIVVDLAAKAQAMRSKEAAKAIRSVLDSGGNPFDVLVALLAWTTGREAPANARPVRTEEAQRTLAAAGLGDVENALRRLSRDAVGETGAPNGPSVLYGAACALVDCLRERGMEPAGSLLMERRKWKKIMENRARGEDKFGSNSESENAP